MEVDFKVNIDLFTKEIKKNNDKDSKWSIMLFIAFICSTFFTMESDNKETAGFVFLLIKCLIILGFSIHYLNQYLSIKMNMGFGIAENEYLYKVAKVQAFPVKEYFNYIRKKLLIWQVAILILGSIKAVMDKSYVEIIFVVFMSIIPALVSFVVQKMFEYRVSNRVNIGLDIFTGILKGIFEVLEIFAIFLYLIIGYIVVWAIISDAFVGKMNQNEIVYRSFKDEITFIVMLVSFIIFIFVCVFNFKTKGKFIRIFVGATLIVTAIVSIVMERNKYIDVTLDEIKVVNFSEKRAYSFDEVESFKVYMHDDSIQIKLFFDDGKAETVFGGVSTSTDTYEEEYFSEYNFAADLVSKLLDKGAKGSISDVEKLRSTVEGYDEELKNGLEEIIGLLGEV